MTATRLYAIRARVARRAVVFRRGPSQHVRLVLWELDGDRFVAGQWFEGRIYERRCDLSPDGTKLVYFAADFSRPKPSWTAVSKPPYLTALALWFKGDAWGGGGLFDTDATISLNHRPGEDTLAEGFELHHRMHVDLFGDRPGWGEDDPIWDTRLRRDGWTRRGDPKEHENPHDTAKIWIEFDPPIAYQKRSPATEARVEMRVRGIKERDGPWYVVDHAVHLPEGRTLELPGSEWADWDDNGDLLYCSNGRCYRLPAGATDARSAIELIDLREQTFEQIEAPASARRWID